MAFNFDYKKTSAWHAVKTEKFFIFRFANIFAQLFLFLFIVSLCLIFFSFFGVVSGRSALKMPVFFLCLYLVFYDLSLFVKTKIRKPDFLLKLEDALASPGDYNLADFLSFESAKIVGDSINFCKKRKIPVSSSSMLYSSIKLSKDVNLICFRLGLDPKKLQSELKNYSEKTPKQNTPDVNFSTDFEKAILEALNVSKDRGHNSIGEKEILVGCARSNDFFKKVLVEYDLKEADVENLTSWLESGEDAATKKQQFWTFENLARQGSLGKDWSSGYTLTLDQFSVDWRNIVSKWTFREIVGHKKEIEQAEMVLARSSNANALVVGDPGTGRKSIVEAIARKCYLGQSLPELNNRRVVELDLVTLATRIQDPEKLESVLDQIFSEVAASGNVILAIDELQNFVGLKENKPGQVDISGILSKYLPIPNFQFIAITDYVGFHKNIEANPSFAAFFRKIEVSEISEIETIQILQSAALEAEYKNKVLILYPAIREIVNLTGRYMPSLPFPKKALDVLDEVVVYVQTKKDKVVLPHHVSEVISEKTEIPVGKMEVKEKETLLNLENLIHQRIVNQAEAVNEISIAMRRARAGISSKTRPMGSFLFLGPTGVGKTETAKALAQIYFGSEEKMIRLDMSEFQAISDIPRLLGAVSPVEMQGLLTTPVRETPFSLVLLDEIEKSHPNILNLFLQVFDEGHITDGQGRKVVFTNTIIICTSNAAADLIFKEVESGKPVEKQQLLGSLIEKATFKPEFINRFDATVIFHPLTKENLMQIAQLSLQGLQKNLKEKEIDFEITEPLKEKIVELSYKPEFGAREMRRVIQDKVENIVAGALLSEQLKKNDRFQINPENFELIINGVDTTRVKV
jgi:ATP-dependent Clp protease ATP-binding subunit ClpC